MVKDKTSVVLPLTFFSSYFFGSKNQKEFMNYINPFFAFAIFIIALSSAWLMQLKFTLKTPSHQFETIDGLRSFQALKLLENQYFNRQISIGTNFEIAPIEKNKSVL